MQSSVSRQYILRSTFCSRSTNIESAVLVLGAMASSQVADGSGAAMAANAFNVLSTCCSGISWLKARCFTTWMSSYYEDNVDIGF